MIQLVLTLGNNVISKYVFDKDIISIGRARDNDVVIDNRAVSRSHARIRREGEQYVLTDLESANGVFVNGKRITKAILQHDDVITIGKHTLTFKHETVGEQTLIAEAYGADRTILVERIPTASLVIIRGRQRDQTYAIEKSEVTIGSSRDCDVCLNEWFVSKVHAVIHRQGQEFLLRDAGSWRGTKVNDVAVTQWILKNGDEIQIGGARLIFRCEAESPALGPTPRPAPEPAKVPKSSRTRKPEVVEAVPDAVTPRMEEPIRAGGAEDFIEPSVPPEPETVREEKTPVRVIAATPPPEALEAPEPRKEITPTEAAVVELTPPAPQEKEEIMASAAAAPKAEVVPMTPAPPQVDAVSQGTPELLDEIRLWEKALKNPSAVIRKQAAKMLKKLTGKDYDY
ncbi:MAG: FHA domain-containing protein [Candidatus Sumerlaeia bacterium]|nr:FHA domain-containing protein [Candidatus Sumerlaeia bacterium]